MPLRYRSFWAVMPPEITPLGYCASGYWVSSGVMPLSIVLLGVVLPWVSCLSGYCTSGYCTSGYCTSMYCAPGYRASGHRAGYGAWQGAGPCLASAGVFKAIMPQFPLMVGCWCRGCNTLKLPPPALSQAGSAVFPAREVPMWCPQLRGHSPRAPAHGLCCIGTCWPCPAARAQYYAYGQGTVPVVVLGAGVKCPLPCAGPHQKAVTLGLENIYSDFFKGKKSGVFFDLWVVAFFFLSFF